MAALSFDDLDGTAPLSEDEAQGALNLASQGGAVITSGQRSAADNSRVGGVSNSLHLKGEAADFTLPPGSDPNAVRAELQRQGYPVTEWLHERAGDPHSTGEHYHWGWGPKGGAAAPPVAGPVTFSDLERGGNTPTPSNGVSGPITFNDLGQPQNGQPDQTWGDMFRSHLATTWDRWKRTAVDAVGLAASALGSQPGQPGLVDVLAGQSGATDPITKWSAQVHNDLTADIQARAPDLPAGSVKALAAQAEDSIIDLAPILASGYVSGGTVLPTLLMGGTAAADTYAQARANGRNPQQAQMDALYSGLVNGTIGSLKLKFLMKSGQSFLGGVLRNAGAMSGLGVISEALQIGYDFGIVGQDTTLSQSLQRLKDAGIVGALTGGFVYGGIHGLNAAVGKVRAMRAPPAPEPRTEPKAEAPQRPQPQPNADLLKKAAIPEPGRKEPAASATPEPVEPPAPAKPIEPFLKPEEMDEKTFRTNPAKIAEEHAAEVSNVEAQATAEAGERHTPEVLKQPPPSAPEPPRTLPDGSTVIGKNTAGQPLFEDKNGVRSYIEDGVRVSEPVQLRPTRGGVQIVLPDHGARPEFSTSDEARANPPSLPEPVQEPAAVTRSPGVALAHAMSAEFTQANGPIPAKRLQELAEREFGGSLASGAVKRDEMYDAAELGLNLALRAAPHVAGHGPFSPITDEAHAERVADTIRDMKDRLPTQTVRAGEKEAFQQFSTPPDYSYAATWAANLYPDDIVLEPSAGTGSFVTHALNAGVREIHVNDLSDRRADMLRSLEPTNVTSEDAEHIDILLPESVKPTVVLMNPPFSQTAGRMGNKKVIETGARHVEAALRRLRPGGRLVAIVGDGMKPGAPTFRAWWDKIGKEYDVRANVGVDGAIYRKYGTTFPTRLLVIDKRPPSGRQLLTLENLKSAADIIRALKDVRDERVPSAGEQPAGEQTGPAVVGGGESVNRLETPVPEPIGVLGVGEGRQPSKRRGARGAAVSGERPAGGASERAPGAGNGVPVAVPQSERPGAGGAGVEPGAAAAGSDGPLSGGSGGAGDGIRPDGSGQRLEPGVTEAPAVVVATEHSLADTADAPLTEAVYEIYKPSRVKIAGAKEHPGQLVQSAAMASVLPPVPKHALAIPKSLIEKGALSDAQIEAVVYAGHAHAQTVPETPGINGAPGLPERRRGFFIGDGTGVGKGREVSGIIMDNWAAGRTKHIWVSEKKHLIQDARRDWKGIGQEPKDVFDHGAVKAADTIKTDRGILFTTYDTLKSAEQVQTQVKDEKTGQMVAKKGRGKSRVDQIVDWVGEDFDGVIAFDEAHNLGNSFDTKANRGVKKAAAKALAGVELQNRLPQARVVYVSATGATEVSNLAYADRLGLWGRGTAFATRNDFLAKISKGGIAAMELVARDMKAMGRYIARNLSYDGVEYERLEHTLSPQQREVYDHLADAWQLVLRNFNRALEAAGVTETDPETGVTKTKNAAAKSAVLSQFWGGHQRFFNQIITSMQMPSVLKAVERDLAEGRQAVLQLVNTNEASQERSLAKVQAEGDEGSLEDLDMTPRDQLMQLIQNAYPTARYESFVDENGNERMRPVVDSKGNVVHDSTLIAAREALLDQLGSIKVPDGPLEMLLNHFGTEQVAEVTGRKQRVVRVRDEKTGELRTVVEKRPASSNVVEVAAFQNAKKPILVFSDAGGTGGSYHADINSDSAGKRRSHYLVQAGWRAAKAVQGLGRTHRTNQASAPIFKLVTTDLNGQKRFVSSIARRLGQLGALTKGERRTGDQGLFGLRDNLESDEANVALKTFFADVLADRVPGVGTGDLENQMGLKLVDKDTGRPLQDLPPMTQFLNRLLSLRTDLQNKVFEEFSKRLDDTIDRAAAAGTLDTGVETYRADKITKRADQVVYTDPESGAETRHVHLETSHRNHPAQFADVVTRLRKSNKNGEAGFVRSRKSGKVFGVQDATSRTDDAGNITDTKRLIGPLDYQFIDADRLDDERYWEPIDDPQAQSGEWDAQVAKIPEFAKADLHLITGAVLPIWDRLAGNPRIYRLQTDAGERMLGRVIPSDSVNATLEALGAEKMKVSQSPAEIAQTVLDDNRTAILANGWKIKRSLVAGEPRLELVGPDFAFTGELKQDGVFTERINWDTRYFIPTENAGAVVERITRTRPVTQLAAPAKEASQHQRMEDRAPGFFSALTRAIEGVKLNRAPAKDWLGLIANLAQKGVKQEEIDWSGVKDWLAGQTKPITKDEVMQHLRENEVQVSEVNKGATTYTAEQVSNLHEALLNLERMGEIGKGAADELMNGVERGESGAIGDIEGLGVPDELIEPFRDQGGGPTKFGTGQGAPLHGGQNYRELLLTLPPPSWWYVGRRDAPSAEAMAKVFKGSHWNEPNVLAHIRFDDRTGQKGEKILHIAEVQSDWHQKGRKGGYGLDEATKKMRDALLKEREEQIVSKGKLIRGYPEFEKAIARYKEINRWLIEHPDSKGVPNAPFKTSWHELAMKRMLRYAAEHGYDKVTWDTGETNATRYDLGQVVDKIEVHPPGNDRPGELLVQARKDGKLKVQQYVKPEKLADLIGKEAADRALSGGNKKRLDNGESATLTGDALKVGGKGMLEFYDKMLPAFMNKYAKKWGAKVGSERMRLVEARPGENAVPEAAVHSVDITPEMRKGVMEGQPLFQRRRGQADLAQHPGTVRLAHDIVAELPHAPSAEEQRTIDRVSAIAKAMIPKAEVVAARNLYATGSLAERREHGVSGATTIDGVRRLVAWSLQSPDAIATLRHEAIHWLRGNGFFSGAEWHALEKAARTGDWLGRHNILTRYPDVGFEGQIEEAVAEQFAYWRRGRGVPEIVRPLFERLAQMLGRVRDYLRQAFGHDVSAENVFRRIQSGEVGARASGPVPAPASRTFGKARPMDASRFQEMEPEERDSAIVEGARNLINVAQDLQMAVAPMARGSDITRATAKDFANLIRAARDFGQFQMERLKKGFTPAELKRMWEAADEASIALQRGRNNLTGMGLDRLTDREREAVEESQADAESVWNAMRKAGQIEGEGIPSYVPHLYVEVGETGYKKLGANRGLRSIPGMGRNVSTTSPHLLHRKYLTAEEGSEAASKKFGVTAETLKDIRTLPLATMRNRVALAGFQLIQTIKEMGRQAGEDWVAEGATPPGYFHIEHPSFYRWRPAFTEDPATGRTVQSVDQAGNKLWQKVPLSVHEAWEGPLRAVLTEPEGAVYSAFMRLKMRAMNNIMFSPLVQLHLLTELGRAFPAAPGKIGSLKLLFEGYAAKNDPKVRLEAVMDGLVPIGHRGAMQDISSITESDNIRPGRSWTAQILGAVPGWLDPRAGDAVKRTIDGMGDFMHNTLLWDRVGDLQFGLYTTMKEWAREKGLSPQTAGRLAAHFANRLAGTLPVESMSPLARKLSNILLFSRTYTLGNMGVFKDALGWMVGAPVNLIGRKVGLPSIGKNWGGLPLDIQSQIKRDAPEELGKVQSIAKRKAMSMLVLDVGLMYAGMSVMQNFISYLQGESLDDILKGYVARWQGLEAAAANNPFSVLNPLVDLLRLSPMATNEMDPATGLPLQRIFVGYDKEGTAIYARNPLGKYAEEVMNWTASPASALSTLKVKLNAVAVRPTLDVLANDRGFGYKSYLYLPTDSAAEIFAKIAAHYMEAMLPMGQIDAARDILMGKAKSTDTIQLAGRTVGMTFRRGAHGGPALGLLDQARSVHDAKVQEALPEIMEQMKEGDVAGARRKMNALGVPVPLQLFYQKVARDPRLRLTPHQLRDFLRYATPQQRADMQRLRGANK